MGTIASQITSLTIVYSTVYSGSTGTGEFPAQMASKAKNVSIWWRHHVQGLLVQKGLYEEVFPDNRPIITNDDIYSNDDEFNETKDKVDTRGNQA